MRGRGFSIASVVGAFAVCLGTVAPLTLAAPQPGIVRVTPKAASAFEPDAPVVTPARAAEYAAVLGLTDEQRTAAGDLLASYLNEQKIAAAQMSQTIDDARAEADESGNSDGFFKTMIKSRETFREAAGSARARYFEDLRLLLTPEQDTRWPALERARRRVETIDRGSISGESVDLIVLVEDEGYTPEVRASLAPVLDAYASALDSALVARNEAQDRLSEKMTPQGGRPVGFFTDNADLISAVQDAALKVRGVNLSYARQVSNSLPDDLRSAFDAEFERRSVPQAYTDTYTQNVLTTAIGLDDLTADQQTRLAALRDRFEHEMDAASDRLAKAIREDEADPGVQILVAEQFGMPAEIRIGAESDDLQRARDARNDVASAYLSQIRALLSPDQQARLPRRESRSRGSMGPGIRTMVIETDEGGPSAPTPPPNPPGR